MARAGSTSYSSMAGKKPDLPHRGGPKEKAGRGRPDDAGASEDDVLWQQVAKSVAPLPRRAAAKPQHPPAEKPKSDAAAKSTPAKPPPAPTAAKHQPAESKAAALSHGAAPSLDKRTAQRLKRGKLAVEGRIDLHGMTQADAQRALTGFIESAHRDGRRCVLVITGKGLKDDWSTGVLRQAVPRWLNEPPLRPLVLGFNYATPKDGGSGALYVLVKRKR